MKNILALVTTLGLFGCASINTPAPLGLVGCASSINTPADPEYLAVAWGALHAIQRVPSTYFVVGPDINAKAKSALAALGRIVVEPDAFAGNERPESMLDYIFLSKFDVWAESAVFETTSDVVAGSKGAPACGLGAKIAMSRKSGAWEVVSNNISLCTH